MSSGKGEYEYDGVVTQTDRKLVSKHVHISTTTVDLPGASAGNVL